MFDITRNGIITMNRGDTWHTQIYVNIGTELDPQPCTLGPDDYLYFGVMEPNQPFDRALIRKRYDASSAAEDVGWYNIDFEVEDTERVLPGTYYYEVKLLRVKNDKIDIDTIIPKTKFVIYE